MMPGVKFNSSGGWISRTLIILAVVMFVAIIIVFVAIKFAANVAKPKDTEVGTEVPEAVYETQIGDIRFLVESATNLGSVLHNPMSNYQQDVVTTEKFIKVIIRAQNKGKVNIAQYSWSLGNLVDSADRIFPSSDQAYYFLPNPDTCGAILKPEFEPVACTRIYEVSRVSTNFKVGVVGTNQNGKQEIQYLDLDVQ